VLAAYERANHDAEASVAKNTMQRTENTTRAMRGMSAQHKDVLRAEIRKFQAERLEAGGQRALKADTRENEPRKDDARMVEVQKQIALKRERLYQAVVKRDNMNRWLQKLTLDEPEEPEVMLDEEMEETEHMHVE
jgi:poly-D-alanine transfer protein DltD